MTEHSQSADVA